ncbi:MAG: hypothetical protein ACLQBA_00965 [Candidatus Binataceae bacterium]
MITDYFKKRNPLQLVLATLLLGFQLSVSESARAQGVVLPLPPEDQQTVNVQLGPGVVGKALPSTPIKDVSVYFPLHERVAVYQVTAGPNVGKMQTLGVAKVRRPNGKVAWRFEFSPSLTGFIRQSPEGDLIIPTVGDASEGVVVVTTPPNPFVIKGMQPGETRSYMQQVRVNALEDPDDQEYSGSLHGTYTYLGTYQVTVPAGTYAAVLLRLKCRGKVGPALTHDTAYYFFAPGKGVVAMISQESATAFWIIHIDTISGKVLTPN